MDKVARAQQRSAIVDMLDSGRTTKYISDELGISQGTVINRKKEIAQGATNGAILTDAANKVLLNGINPKAQVEKLNARLTTMWDETTDPEEIYTLNEQILKQLKFYVDLCEKLYNIQRVEVFMEAVVEVMEEVDSDLVHEFRRKLNKKSAMAGQRFDL